MRKSPAPIVGDCVPSSTRYSLASRLSRQRLHQAELAAPALSPAILMTLRRRNTNYRAGLSSPADVFQLPCRNNLGSRFVGRWDTAEGDRSTTVAVEKMSPPWGPRQPRIFTTPPGLFFWEPVCLSPVRRDRTLERQVCLPGARWLRTSQSSFPASLPRPITTCSVWASAPPVEQSYNAC